MTLEQVAFGAAGAVLALGKLYYTLGILRNLRAVDAATIAMTFPHGRAQVALKALLGAFLVFAAGMALGSIGLAHAMPVLDTLSKVGAGIGLLGWVYFLHVLADITDLD